MLALVNLTLASGKFAWQLMGTAHVRATPPPDCKADLAEFCRADAVVQHEAMHYPLAGGAGPTKPKHMWTNCSVFGCTCKGEVRSRFVSSCDALPNWPGGTHPFPFFLLFFPTTRLMKPIH